MLTKIYVSIIFWYHHWACWCSRFWKTAFLQKHSCSFSHAIWMNCHMGNTCLFYINSLWHSDAIWRQRSGSTLAQVDQAIIWTNVDLSLVRSSDIHLRAASQEIPQPSITKSSLKIMHIYKISSTSPRGQWVICVHCSSAGGSWFAITPVWSPGSSHASTTASIHGIWS